MRKITLTLLALVVFAAAYCGVPQAINYQAVVQNATTGSPIKDKTVSLRLSILAGSATGTVSYEETQSVTTDGIGVISVNIGNGTVVSGSYAGINWSTGVYYLKTEVDTTGGTNYITVGTVEFFSVPYAEYAATAASTNLSSLEYPDGLNSMVPVSMSGSFSYIVPSGQTLYVTDITGNGSATCTNYGIDINGVFIASNATGDAGGAASGSITGNNTAANAHSLNFPFAMPAGYAINSTSCGTSLVGFTIPSNYSWVVFDLSTGNYTVPAGKVLVIRNVVPTTGANWNGTINIGSNTTSYTKNINFVDQANTVSASGLSGSLLMMGYLKNR